MRRMLDCHWHDYVTCLIISELIYITSIFLQKKIWWNLDYKMWSYWLDTMIKISAKKMLQWCPLLDWPYLYQYVTLCNDIHIAGRPRCKAFEQCLRRCIWFSIYGDIDQCIHSATSLQHFFCSLYKVMDLFIFSDMNISEINVFTSLEISRLTSCTHLPPHSLHSHGLCTLFKSNLYYMYFYYFHSFLSPF